MARDSLANVCHHTCISVFRVNLEIDQGHETCLQYNTPWWTRWVGHKFRVNRFTDTGITSKFLLGVSASWARELAGGGTNFCRWTKQRVIGRCEPFLYNLVCSRRVIHFRMIQAYDGESRTQYMRMSHHYIFRKSTNGWWPDPRNVGASDSPAVKPMKNKAGIAYRLFPQ